MLECSFEKLRPITKALSLVVSLMPFFMIVRKILDQDQLMIDVDPPRPHLTLIIKIQLVLAYVVLKNRALVLFIISDQTRTLLILVDDINCSSYELPLKNNRHVVYKWMIGTVQQFLVTDIAISSGLQILVHFQTVLIMLLCLVQLV